MSSNGVERNLIGLDLNAGRLRAVSGITGIPRPLPLDGDSLELPMALSLEGRRLEVGLAGVQLCRRLPHLACVDFLSHLGDSRQWNAGRHSFDAVRALELVLEQLPPICARAEGMALSVPVYLTDTQVSLLTALATKARLPVVGSMPTSLALALTACAEHPWPGPALVLDADLHALTVAVISNEGHEVRLLDAHVLPELGMRVWKERLLNVAADQCIRQSRRDLRDSASAEQSVYEQLDAALEASRRGKLARLTIQTATWFQNLLLQPEELAGFCVPLVRKTMETVRAVRTALDADEPMSLVLLSESAGQLPGLVAALEADVEARIAECADDSAEDFGEALLEDGVAWSSGVHVLDPDAAARAALAMAEQVLRGDLPCGHRTSVPLSGTPSSDAGLPRLQFRGRDHLINRACFTLGRQTNCDLVFDAKQYPAVSAHHCDIVYDRRAYFLRDRSRNGTLVNDRPVRQQVALHAGDWIRLGPSGPLLRFLGRASDQLNLMPTA